MDSVRWVIPLAIAVLALRLRLLQPFATLAGFLVGLAVVYSPHQPSHSMMLLMFFIVGSGATKFTARLRTKMTPPTAPQAAMTQKKADASQLRRRRRRQSRSPSTGSRPLPQQATHVRASDAADAKHGRSLAQVLAVGLVPALLCVARERWHTEWSLCYVCYLAACAGDTLASEFGSLSDARPLLVSTLQPVPAGTDGAISLFGTLASLVGGALVGSCTGTSVGIVVGVAAGGAGSLLDSVLGSVIQQPAQLAGKPRLWKLLNCLVNLISASAVAAAAPVAAAYAQLVLPPLALMLLLLCAATTGMNGTNARKVLHLGTSFLIVMTDAAAPAHVLGSTTRPLLATVAALVAICSALSWSRVWATSPLGRFEVARERPKPGITLYSIAVLVVVMVIFTGNGLQLAI
jgi:uncharacterized protein (TIGR00297 family)